ncbi:DNA-directed RNA polymerase subunit delta [Mycoplasmoides pirum]|uniref:DNA-directed RNA polymerase subunit delta n=1 Tax=Mycoplasmoides pirum TaxID=2122 RepID=UPI00056AD251|nr:DNA-directed RNA polymerase subunit delta [Mycoplasmoides pirum]
MNNLIDQAFTIAQSQFKNRSFDFNALWKEVVKKNKFSKDEEAKVVGNFYLELLQDLRFVHIGDRKWRLRETMKYNEWDKISQSMFGIKEYYEEGYENFQPEKSDEDTLGLDTINMSNEDNISDTNYVQNLLDSETENHDDDNDDL